MDYVASTSWLQQQPLADIHDTHPNGNDDWKEATSNVAAGPSSAQPTMDLSDFDLDLTAPAASSSLSQPTPAFFQFTPAHGNYFLSGTHSSYNPSSSYSGPQWPAPSAPHIPVSSYSSLNGATTVSSSGQSLLPASPPQMMIDPALTTMSNSNNISQYSHPQQLLLSQPHSRTQYPYQHTSHSSTLSINPSFVNTTASHFQHQPSQRPPSQPHTSPPPVTLAPYVLHSPQNHNLLGPSPISTSSLHGSAELSAPPPAPPPVHHVGPTPEQLKERFLLGLRPLLRPDSFTGAGAVTQLTSFIFTYGIMKVDIATRLEILSKIRDNAPNHYFRAWAENGAAMTITKKWLMESGSAEPSTDESTATMPLLHIVDRLPMTVTTLKESGIGKEIKRLSKSAPASAVRDMSSNIANKWRALISSAGVQAPSVAKTITEDADAKSKKRKAEEPPAGSKGAPATKKAPVAAASAAKVSVPTKKPLAKAPTKDTPKADSSFFSAPKQKPKLPDFKKTPASVKKEPDINIAQPSSYDPFAEIVKTMKTRKDSPVVATPPSVQVIGQATLLKKSGKKKSVKWAPDGQLERVKIIERAVYDDDPADGIHATHSLRELDRSEGAALIAHLFEEQIDYVEPPLLDIPPTIEVPERGKDSVERVAQEEREKTALSAAYMSDAHIPDSGAEPSFQIPEDQVDQGAQLMQLGPELEALCDAPMTNEPSPPPPQQQQHLMSASVAELVGQLSGVAPSQLHAPDVTMSNGGGGGVPSGMPYNNYDPAMLAGFGPEQLQQILQQAQALQTSSSSMFPPQSAPAGTAAPPPHASAEQGWGSNGYSPYENAEDARWGEDGWRGGGPGRGRGRGRGKGGFGRGNRRKPCVFHQEGRCRYGDQCDFSHDTGLNY